MKKIRRTAAIALAILSIPIGAHSGSAATNDSGTLGNWSLYPSATSTERTIQQVNRANGLYMSGDSISVSTARQLAEMLRPTGDLIAVDNWSGRPTVPAVSNMSTWIKTYGPHRMLMATGTNDIFNPSVMTSQIDKMMSTVGPNHTVYWVSVHCSRWNYSTAIQQADLRNSKLVNDQLYRAAARYPNLKIIPWDKWLSEKPARYRMYLRDGVHTNAAGSLFRNTIIKRFIAGNP